jgi:hypothetical protein
MSISSPPSPPKSSTPPKSTLDLSIPSSGIQIPFQYIALDSLDSSHYDALLRALRDAPEESRTHLSVAIELVDIIHIAGAILDAIGKKCDVPTTVDSWRPIRYDLGKLENPGSDPTEPDDWFSQHATTKARVTFRVTAKDIYHRVKHLGHADRLKLAEMYDSLPLHEQMSAWIGRFEKMVEVMKTEGPPRKESRRTGSRKRQRGL